MPALVRLYFRHVAFGSALSAVFVAVLLGWNVADLRSLLSGGPAGYVTLAMLFGALAVVFAGVQAGLAMMERGMTEGRVSSPAPRGRAPDLIPIPIPVERRADHRRR